MDSRSGAGRALLVVLLCLAPACGNSPATSDAGIALDGGVPDSGASDAGSADAGRLDAGPVPGWRHRPDAGLTPLPRSGCLPQLTDFATEHFDLPATPSGSVVGLRLAPDQAPSLLVTTSAGLWVAARQPDGTLALESAPRIPAAANRLAVGDFDGDGMRDLALCSTDDAGLAFAFVRDGGFQLVEQPDQPACTTLVSVPMERDARDALGEVLASGAVEFWEPFDDAGLHSLGRLDDAGAGWNANGFDWDDDGVGELWFTAADGGLARVYPGPQGLEFRSIPTPDGANPALILDLKGDGLPDLVTAVSGYGIGADAGITSWQMTGGGTFIGPVHTPVEVTNGVFGGIAPMNLDGRGGGGVLGIAYSGDSRLIPFRAEADGTFTRVADYGGVIDVAPIAYLGAVELQATDDVYVISGNRLTLLVNQGDGRLFAPEIPRNATPSAVGTTTITAGDFRGTGEIDFIAGELYRNHGGVLTRDPDFFRDGYVGPGRVFDLDGDGRDDVVAGDAVELGLGDGGFFRVYFGLPWAMSGERIEAVDVVQFGGEPAPKLLRAESSLRQFWAYPDAGVADAGFIFGPDDAGANGVSVGDFDEDHQLDVVSNGTQMHVYLRRDGGFVDGWDYPGTLRNVIHAPRVADLNGDGHLDVLDGDTATAWLGFGDGGFQTSPAWVPGVAYAVVPRPGQPALVLASAPLCTLCPPTTHASIWRWDPDAGQLAEQVRWELGQPLAAAAADFDGDGRDDLAVVRQNLPPVVIRNTCRAVP